MIDDRWLTVEDIAAYLGVKRLTVYRWIDSGGMPAHKRGKLWLFKKSEVDRWVRSDDSAARPAVPGSTATKQQSQFVERPSEYGGVLFRQSPQRDVGVSVSGVEQAGRVGTRLQAPENQEPTASGKPSTLVVIPGGSVDIPESAKAQVGVVMGLTAGVGMPLRIEALSVTGRGHVVPNGAVSRVMAESVAAAVSFVDARPQDLGPSAEALSLTDVVVLADVGDVPSQTDTLGAAVAVALLSSLTSAPIRRFISVAGRVGPDGALLPLDDIAQRLHSAVCGGAREAYIPMENKTEAESLPFLATSTLKVIPVGSIAEILHLCAVPGQLDMFKMAAKTGG